MAKDHNSDSQFPTVLLLSLRRKDLKEKRKKRRRGDAESGSSGSTLFGNVYRELSGLCGKLAE